MTTVWLVVLGVFLLLSLALLLSWFRRSRSVTIEYLEGVPSLAKYSPDAELLDEVTSWIRADKKIMAIKVYRERTGATLQEAKERVEAIARQLQPEAPREMMNLDALGKQMVALLARREKIQAIKLYRAQIGVGLKEAKDAVERLEAGMPLTLPTPQEQERYVVSDEEIQRLLLSGKKIQAIKLYREQTGVGLKEAKNTIDALERLLRSGLS